MNTVTLIVSFALTGAVVSAVVEYTKGFLAKATHRTVYVVGVSVLGGLVVYFFHLVPTNIVETLVGVWAAANTVYVAVTQYLGTSTPASIQPATPTQ